MPIRDQGAMERSLDNDYGPTRGPNAPDSFEVMLLDATGEEIPGTTEGVANGYARPTHPNDAWLAATGGAKVSEVVTFAAPTGAWETAYYWALRDPLTGLVWDYSPLTEPLDVTGPGTPVTLVMTVFYEDNLDL
jgi:hypothetical protein